MLSLSVTIDHSVAAVLLDGRFDTLSSTMFGEELRPLLEKEEYLIIDFAECKYLSSSGIRHLMIAAKKLGSKGGALILTRLSNEVLQVIEVTGLKSVFQVFNSVSDARDEIVRLKKGSLSSLIQSGRLNFIVQNFEKYAGEVTLWKDYDVAGYDELGIALGIGSAAESPAESENNNGIFITLGNCAGFLPFGENLSIDFRIPHQQADAGVFVRWALSFGITPQSMVSVSESSGQNIGEITDSIIELSQQTGLDKPRSVLIAGHNENRTTLSLVVLDEMVVKAVSEAVFPEEPGHFFRVTPQGIRIAGALFLLDNRVLPGSGEVLEEYLKKALTIDKVESVGPIDLSLRMTSYSVWLFNSMQTVESGVNRLRIETINDFVLEPYQRFLTRRLYRDSSRVVIQQLHGGYSARTFQVDSYDPAGRKLRPTVMKMASRAMIIREADRCQRYSLPYIMNNSAIVLGTEFYCETGALRYNFVGIGGEKTELKWLANYYNEWPVEKLEPLFDKIFTRILKPWYGQPLKEKICPYHDQNPVSTFFPNLCSDGEKLLSVSADVKYFTVAETGQELINPYWFLKHEYIRRRAHAIDYFTSVCHGDLNMQNILLDSDQNVYLIDFSETRPRSVISDFARLEAIFMIEKTPLNTPEDFKDIMEFSTRFYCASGLDQMKEIKWNGANASIMTKNIALTKRMRHYGIDSARGETTIVPYYIALLEWILPIVCYSSVSPDHKKLSAYVAGLICQNLIVTDCFS